MSKAFPRMEFYRLFLLVAPIILAEGKQEKCDKKIDLAIVLDSSASIGEENFHLSKEFAKKLCRRFAIAEDKVHVSITSYSMHVTTLPSFTDSYNEKSIESDVDKHVYEASSTRTGRALRVVIGKFNEQRGGARAKDPDVKKVAVIVTDGFSSTGEDFMKEKAGFLRNAGIETFVVGITRRVNDEELKILSSKPTKLHLFSLNNSTVIKGVVDSIVKQSCE